MASRLPKAALKVCSHGRRVNSKHLEDLHKLGEAGLCDAIEIAEFMEQQGNVLTRDNAYWILQECEKKKDLECGRRVQSIMIHSALDSVAVLCDHLIRLLSYHGRLLEANQVFNKILTPTVHTWAAIILGNGRLGQEEVALELHNVIQFDMEIDKCICLAALKACIMSNDIIYGRIIHHCIIAHESRLDLIVGNTLVDMYAKCGGLQEACHVFHALSNPDVVSWNIMIGAYKHFGDGTQALECFQKMQEKVIVPNRVTFFNLLKVSVNIQAIQQGRVIHQEIIERGLISDIAVGSTVVDMYAKCGSLEEAIRAFQNLSAHSVVSWNALIAAYAQHGEGFLSLETFGRMQMEGANPNESTFSSALKACTTIGAIEQGRLIHSKLVQSELLSDVIVGSTIVDMYAKCGNLEEAENAFSRLTNRNVVSWSAMIAGYALHGEGVLALEYFGRMEQEGIKPNEVTFLDVLKACVDLGTLARGRVIHEKIIKSRLESNIAVGNKLIDMYVKCGSHEDAQHVFDKLPDRNVVSWCALIAGYVEHEEPILALEYFKKMQDNSVQPNEVTWLSVLKACGNMGALEHCQLIHERIVGSGQVGDMLCSALIDTYAKCGAMDQANKLFCKFGRNLFSWNMMVSGYAYYGEGLSALDCLRNMQQEGIKPNEVSMTSILIACSHAGLVDEALLYFQAMGEYYEVKPTLLHYTCIVDLLGRAGWLHEAEDLLQNRSTDVMAWMSLLSACRMHEDIEIGRRSFNQMVNLNSNCIAGYILMSNITACVQEKPWICG